MVNYHILAPIYDRIMAHVKYQNWAALIGKVFNRYLSDHPPTIFEIGAGTGTLAHVLLKRGYLYTGSDLSCAMCKEALKKNVALLVANGLDIPVRKKFSLVIFLYDGINYLQSLRQLSLLFKQVYTILEPQGIFLFDITTEVNSIKNFFDTKDSEDFGNISYTRHSYFDSDRKIQHNDFVFYILNTAGHGSFHIEQCYENHKQTIYSPEEIVRVIDPKQYSIEGIWDNFSMTPFKPSSERIHFVLRKI